MSGKLYLVGTPIGNLDDFSPRAAETLRNADFIAAEDTRVTLKLLNRFDIHKPLVSYYEHNKYSSGEKIFPAHRRRRDLRPGHRRRYARHIRPRRGHSAHVRRKRRGGAQVPGPSALISALALSGLPTGASPSRAFCPSGKSRREHLARLMRRGAHHDLL
jgi:16S rRNA (cytidine1402-2'-O)-methyltransferase